MPKVKHTKNGNVKMVMSLEEAQALRTFLYYAPSQVRTHPRFSGEILDNATLVDLALALADIPTL